MTRRQDRILAVALIGCFVVPIGARLLWGHGNEGWAVAVVVMWLAATIGAAVYLSLGVSRARGVSFWSVILLRRPDRPE